VRNFLCEVGVGFRDLVGHLLCARGYPRARRAIFDGEQMGNVTHLLFPAVLIAAVAATRVSVLPVSRGGDDGGLLVGRQVAARSAMDASGNVAT
jgi:hypothetical protein